MTISYENIIQTYDRLTAGNSSAWDIYAGERSQAMAEEKGIPQGKWLSDRMAMQLGQEVMAYELSQGNPFTHDKWNARLRGMISRHVSSLLRGESSDMARKGLLLQILSNNLILEAHDAEGEVDDEEIENLRKLDLTDLQDAVVDLGVKWTKQRVLPLFQQQCNLLNQSPEYLTSLLNNPAGLAVAGYLEIPEIRNAPETVGAIAEGVSYCQNCNDADDDNLVHTIALVLLSLAVMLTILALIMLSTGWLTAGATYLLAEGTAAGITAFVAEEMAFISGYALSMLKVAAGSTVLSGLTALVAKLFHTIDSHDADESISNANIRTHRISNAASHSI